ncbi:MAG TPA: hypothetical protein VHW46_02655, partial [Terracidiphilus sp.]|nr:hypothetical protein [Terracidiphilus sp.]
MLKASPGILCLLALAVTAGAQSRIDSSAQSAKSASAAPKPAGHPVTFSIYERARNDTWQWFAAPPASATYPYLQSLLRIAVAQRLAHWDWQAEMTQAWVGGVPNDAIAPVAAQGQLGLGGTYYAAGGNNTEPAAAFFKQGFVRYDAGPDKNIRVGRFEFLEGVELHPKDPTVLWLQNNRVQQHLIGNFGFANAQRSVDGIDAHFGSGSWDITAMAARSDQGVFNMNGNPELNVDAQYLAYSRMAAHGRVIARAFGIG